MQSWAIILLSVGTFVGSLNLTPVGIPETWGKLRAQLYRPELRPIDGGGLA